MQDTKLLTPSGKKKLESELLELKERISAVVQKIKDAKELGDLSENAEYHIAKEEQAILASRIMEIEALLKRAVLVNPTTSNSKVALGSKIKVKTDGEVYEYEIVGMNEADPLNGKISINSPLGAGLLGAKKGDTIEVNIPAGKVKYKVVEIL
jgi:transcription elongation factor GreA